MPRTEARIRTTLWDDADFLSLGRELQWLYLFLLSQPDLEHTGVLALRRGRLAKRARCTPDELMTLLWELDKARYIVVDEDTEEVCVRSLLRRDEVYRQPYTLGSARKALVEVESLRIRWTLLAEVERIADECRHNTPAGSVPILADMIEILAASVGAERDTTSLPASHESTSNDSSERTGQASPENGMSDGMPEGMSDGMRQGMPDGYGEGGGEGERLSGRTNTGDGARTRATTTTKKKRTTSRGTRISPDFAATVTQDMVKWAVRVCPLVDGRAETAIFVDHWLGESGAKAAKKDWVAAWRTWMRKAQGYKAERAARSGDVPLTQRRVTADEARCAVDGHDEQPAENCALCAADRYAGAA